MWFFLTWPKKSPILVDFSLVSRYFGQSSIVSCTQFLNHSKNSWQKSRIKTAGSFSFALWSSSPIDQFRYIEIQPKTIHFSARLWRINPTNSVVIPRSLVLRSIVLDWILIYQNWSIQLLFTVKRNYSVFLHDLERVNKFLRLISHVKFSSNKVDVVCCLHLSRKILKHDRNCHLYVINK